LRVTDDTVLALRLAEHLAGRSRLAQTAGRPGEATGAR
jgi:hypothetical protein